MTAKKQAPKKKAVTKKKAAKAPARKKAAPKKKVTRQRTKAERKAAPIPKYHLNHRDWDRKAVMNLIAERLGTSSDGIASICNKDPELPDISTVFLWFDEEARAGGGPILDMYARAREAQADFMADEIIDIADNEASEPVVIDGVPVIVKGELVKIRTPAAVNHARLRVDARKWVASKLKPRKYGDKLELSGDPERPLAGLTDEQLDAQIAMLQEKLAGGAQ